MMDPLRLLETARGGLEQDLLRSALTEVAPDAVRARVLQSVSEVLASPASVATSAGSSTSSSASAGVSIGVRGPGGLSKLALALKSVNGYCLAGVLAIAVGGAAHYLTRGGVVEAPLQGHTVRSESSANVQTPGAVASKTDRAATPSTASGARADDGLDAQLTLLAQARQALKSGRLDDAALQLDLYEQRFPRGALSPEVVVLRERLHEQRWARIPPPRTSQPRASLPRASLPRTSPP
jgi:hypothetical protein